MEANTERSMRDKVWVMFENRTLNSTIVGISYRKFISPVDCKTLNEVEVYSIETENGRSATYRSDEVFSTRQELIDSL